MLTVEIHDGIYVVRDDLLPGGTKSRYLSQLFDTYNEVVYATPAYGGAQLALAYCAKNAGKKVTLFVAQRKEKHPRTKESENLGANIVEVFPRYLNVVQSRARKYAEENGAHYLEFGGDSTEATSHIAKVAAHVNEQYGPFDQIWSAAGSGVLTRGLQEGIKAGDFFGVQIGRDINNPGRATILKHYLDYQQESKVESPFPSCPNYDKKAWEFCKEKSAGKVLFWNVMGPS